MSKSAKLSDQDQVTSHIQKLDPVFEKLIEDLRQIILSADKQVSERIKWNNPSFYYSGEMKPFDPKEYKREIIVLNLHKKKDYAGLAKWSKIINQYRFAGRGL